MKKLFLLTVVLVFLGGFFSSVHADSLSAATYVVDSVITKSQKQSGEFMKEGSVEFIGHFSYSSQAIDDLVNSGSFKADLKIVIGDNVLAIDYHNAEVGKTFCNITPGYENAWFSNNKFFIPFEMDVFYLDQRGKIYPHQHGANIRVVNVSTKEILVKYNTNTEWVRKDTFVFEAGSGTYGFYSSFVLYPEVLKDEMKNVFDSIKPAGVSEK